MKKLLTVSAMMTALSALSPACAATYLLSFDSSYGNFAGSFVTAPAASPFELITNLTGTLGGNAVTLLAPNAYVGNDNLFKPTAPNFNFGGVSFASAGQNYNIYSNGGAAIFCGRTDGCDFPVSFSNFSVQTAAVPEPSTWALFLVGFGAIGGAMRARRKVRVTARFA